MNDLFRAATHGVSLPLLKLLLSGRRLVKLGLEDFTGLQAKGLLNEPAGFTAFAASESLRFDFRLTVGSDKNLNGFQMTPPTRTVSLMDPSASGCSKTVCPFFRASSFAFSTA